MPDEDGQQICRELRRDPDCDSIAILFLSGMALQDQAVAAIRAGADGYMSKPFDLHTLENIIAELIRRKAAGQIPETTYAA